MMTALMLAREGITGSWQPPEVTARSVIDSPDLGHLSGPPQTAVIDYELMAPLFIDFEQVVPEDGPLRGVAYLCHSDALHPGPLVELMRLAAPGPDVFAQQLDYLHHYADLRADRMEEIDVQLTDLTSFFAALAHIHPARNKATLAFIQAALRFCAMVQFRIKHGFGCPRPSCLSPQIQPMIQTPAHGSLPSGHATEAIFLATLFKALAEELSQGLEGERAAWLQQFNTQCDRLAVRIAASRTVAGVHFPVDSAAGAVLGDTLARYVLARVKAPAPGDPAAETPVPWRKLDADMSAFGAADYTVDTMASLRDGGAINGQTVTTVTTGELPLRYSPQLNWLWSACRAELRRGAPEQES
ncbi:phosphatase PAP2 family protein [Tritonibacter horizontis]|uniref:PAP2 superfamily protein n=1 Tax=Tritonibacter horizontis TaxID=1768241 RepID=A0A132BXC1_9RHOB|nr:phosphatase PAP2 family protein [Tritonibacter horizontis]KUP92934.1 PAP2 superfamily protein [Tritonibacter horizontis]